MELVDLYERQQKTIAELSQYYGVARGTISRWLARVGIPSRRRGKPRFGDERIMTLVRRGMPYKQVATLLGIDRHTIWDVIQRSRGKEKKPCR